MDEQLLARLVSIEDRLESVDASLRIINHEMGVLAGKIGHSNHSKVNPTVSLVIRCIVLPLIIILGGLAGVKVFFPV